MAQMRIKPEKRISLLIMAIETPKRFAFINSQSLNLGIRDAGWVFDFAKFYKFLVDRYLAELVYLFIGQFDQNQALYAYLEKIGT